MSAPDLEARLRSYYGTFRPENSTRLMLTSAHVLEDARRSRPRRSPWAAVRMAATLAAAAVLLAALAMARFGGGAVGPGAGSGSPGPTFDVTGALAAQVDQAGLTRTGGIWAVEGSYLLTSTDNGATWRAGSFPAANADNLPLEAVYVLDQDHAWALTPDTSNGGPAGQAIVGTLSRTSDGGRTWQSTPVSGDFDCQEASLSFVNAERGFMMCAVPSTPGPSGPLAQSLLSAKEGSGTVLATDDGGASWSVAGSAPGLSEDFTASDADTLWSVPDTISSELTGVYLYVSRDGGRTWAAVPLKGLASVPANTQVAVQAGPVFWDASNGAIAVGVDQCCSIDTIAIWFYRTSDGGRTWSVSKEPRPYPLDPFAPNAAVGRVWAVIGIDSLFNLTISSDFGVSWTEVSGSGMPANSPFLTLEFVDRNHGVGTVFAGGSTSCGSQCVTASGPSARVLMLTSDGGLTWHPADFGDARARVSSTSADPVAAANLAANFEVMSTKSPPDAWNDLSAYSQKAFGSETAFATAEAALGQRTGYVYHLGTPGRGAEVLSAQSLGQGLWVDLSASADLARAYVVAVTFPGTSEPAELLVVAPLSATGEWRVWVASNAPAAAASPKIGREEAISLASAASGYSEPLVGTVELKADGSPFWPGRMVWSVQFDERAGASSGAALVYVDAITGATMVVGRG